MTIMAIITQQLKDVSVRNRISKSDSPVINYVLFGFYYKHDYIKYI